MNMHCEQFEQILEQQDEGALPKPALAHLETCEACRALSADFGAIHDMALELGHDEIAPPERVWISLRNQLEAERLILDPQEAPRSASRASSGWWSVFQHPAVAGAFLGLVLAAASTIGYLSNFAQTSRPLSIGDSARDFSRSRCGQCFQGRSSDRGKRLDSGPAKAGHRRNRFHPPEPSNC